MRSGGSERRVCCSRHGMRYLRRKVEEQNGLSCFGAYAVGRKNSHTLSRLNSGSSVRPKPSRAARSVSSGRVVLPKSMFLGPPIPLFHSATPFRIELVVRVPGWPSAASSEVPPQSPRLYLSCTNCPPSRLFHSAECGGTERLRSGISSEQNPTARSRHQGKQTIDLWGTLASLRRLKAT